MGWYHCQRCGDTQKWAEKPVCFVILFLVSPPLNIQSQIPWCQWAR